MRIVKILIIALLAINNKLGAKVNPLRLFAISSLHMYEFSRGLPNNSVKYMLIVRLIMQTRFTTHSITKNHFRKNLYFFL